MNNKNHKKVKISDYIFIFTAYAFIVGQLIFLTFKREEPPDLYFALTLGIIVIWNKVIPRDKYLNIIRYISNSIYVVYGLYKILRMFN